jgi:3-oxoacyl-[acyl-carrier protein] reductase
MPSEKRNLVILGANSDIGTALLRRSMQTGYRILAVSRSSKPIAVGYTDQSLKWLEGVDLTRGDDLTRLQTVCRDYTSGPFNLVHSVGDFWTHKPLLNTSLAEVRCMYESHYLTLCGAARVLLPLMVSGGGGRLVAFSCNSVVYNYPDMAPFTAAKAAVECFVKCIAHEYAEYGISANVLALPTILTDKVVREKLVVDEANYIRPDELAEMILEQILELPPTVNGTVVKVFKHNNSFYNSGYFDRNPRTRT